MSGIMEMKYLYYIRVSCNSNINYLNCKPLDVSR